MDHIIPLIMKRIILYMRYLELAKNDSHVIFGGRLGQYKYFDMDKVIAEALQCVKNNLK